jgi:hypothetical protein
VLESLETTGIALWLRESPSVWSFPTVLTLHTAGLMVVVGACWLLDIRLLGITRKVPLSAFRWVFSAVAVGLVVNVVTGVLLFIKNATVWGASIPFFVKMGLVVGAAATVLPIRSYVLRSSETELEVSARARLLAIASIVVWTAAVVAGRLLAYLQP